MHSRLDQKFGTILLNYTKCFDSVNVKLDSKSRRQKLRIAEMLLGIVMRLLDELVS